MVRRLVLPIWLSSILSYEMGTILLCCTQHHSSFLRALLSFPPSECSYDLWRGKNGQVLNDVTSNGKKMLLKSVMVTIFHEFPVHEIQALGIESTFISLSICKCDVFSPNTWPMTIIFKLSNRNEEGTVIQRCVWHEVFKRIIKHVHSLQVWKKLSSLLRLQFTQLLSIFTIPVFLVWKM